MSPSSVNVLQWSPRRFLFIDACVFFVFGVFLFLWPSAASELLFTNATDGVHWHIMRCIGGQLIGNALVLYRLSQSAHGETHTSCFILRILMSTLMMVVILHAKTYFKQHFEPYTIQLFIASSIGTIILYAWQLVRINWPIGHILLTRDRHISNCLYQLDSFVSLVIGVAWISFPDWLLHRQVAVTLDGSHLFLGRVMGVFFCASNVVSSHSLYWSKASDRRLAVTGRAAMNACILSAQIWSQISYHDDWSGNHWVGISLFSSWTIITFLYLIITSDG